MTIIKASFGRRHPSSSEKSKKEGKEKAFVYQLHVALAFSDPLIWRRLLVPGETTLHQLHRALQICMGWTGKHNHQFYVGKVFYDAGETAGRDHSYHEALQTLGELEEAMKWCFTYIYDAGDGWEHEITLEAVRPAGDAERVWIIDGEWAAPPERVGSIQGYSRFLYALEHPEAQQSVELLEKYDMTNFDPARFDADSLNIALGRDKVLDNG